MLVDGCSTFAVKKWRSAVGSRDFLLRRWAYYSSCCSETHQRPLKPTTRFRLLFKTPSSPTRLSFSPNPTARTSLSLFLLLTKICFNFNTVTFFALCYINDDYDRFYWIGGFFFYCKLGASINTIWLKRSICDLILQNFHSQTRIFSQSIRVGSPIWRHLWQMH